MVRRLFGGYTVITMSLMMIMGTLLYFYMQNPMGTGFKTDLSRGQTFTVHYTAKLWHKPEQLRFFLQQMERDFDAKVTAISLDKTKELYAGNGRECTSWTKTWVIVHPDTNQRFGRLTFCPTHSKFQNLKKTIPFIIIALALLIASWVVARTLTRPLNELADVAEDIGEGNLSSRSKIAVDAGGELALLGKVFNNMAERIEQQIREQRTLLAAVSHELRTPLGHLRLLIEMGREGKWKPERLDQLEREVLEMDDLVDQLLVSSRLQFELKDIKPISTTEIVIEAIERMGLEPTILDVRTEAAIECDPTLVQRALANMIRNANQHGHGVTNVIVEQTAGRVCFWVEDRGPGIPDEAVQRLFEPFVQSQEHDTQGALGLGMFLIKRIALAHKGEVRIKQATPHGACIGLCLPILSLH